MYEGGALQGVRISLPAQQSRGNLAQTSVGIADLILVGLVPPGNHVDILPQPGRRSLTPTGT